MFHHISKHHKVRWKHPVAHHIACVGKRFRGARAKHRKSHSSVFLLLRKRLLLRRVSYFQLCSRYLKKWWHMCLIYITPSIQLAGSLFLCCCSRGGGLLGGLSYNGMGDDKLKYLPKKPKLLQSEKKNSWDENPDECLSRAPPRQPSEY